MAIGLSRVLLNRSASTRALQRNPGSVGGGSSCRSLAPRGPSCSLFSRTLRLAFSSASSGARGGAVPPRQQQRAVTMSSGNGTSAGGADPAPPPSDPKLESLRAAMADAVHGLGKGVDAYIVPSEDAHMSEYAPDCDNRRAFISGFTGSAGCAAVTAGAAALWTDGRYFLQAEQELGPSWTLMKGGVAGTPELSEWLLQQVPKGGRVGVDPFLHTMESARKLEADLKAKGRHLVPIYAGNLVDTVWGSSRPAAPKGAIVVHPLEWAGVSVEDKLEKLTQEAEAAGADSLLVTMLDEVAWCLNLRGEDVAFNPVFVSYALLNKGKMSLYVDSSKVTKEAASHLESSGVDVKEYDELLGDVKSLAASGSKILMDPAKVSYAIGKAAEEDSSEQNLKRKADQDTADQSEESAVVEATSPVAMAKALKTAEEMAGMQEAHLRDGVAAAKFLSWLEAHTSAGGSLTEVEVDERFTGLRAQQQGFKQPSFATIAGEGPNGAIIHYRAEPGTCRTVTPDSMILIDSGGQYDCGTTDVTRTLHTGIPTEYHKATFTAVLKGHIALASAVFPPGTPGIAIDALARTPLWAMGLNYRHGTGHGVGAALNVHEGPHTISTRYHNHTPLKAGMVVSNEPGYYESGGFGIRIENLLQVVEKDTPHSFADERYLGFSELTLIPLQRKLIDVSALSPQEVAWIDAYHVRVWEEVSPRLGDGDKDVAAWLKSATEPLPVTSLVAA